MFAEQAHGIFPGSHLSVYTALPHLPQRGASQPREGVNHPYHFTRQLTEAPEGRIPCPKANAENVLELRPKPGFLGAAHISPCLTTSDSESSFGHSELPAPLGPSRCL